MFLDGNHRTDARGALAREPCESFCPWYDHRDERFAWPRPMKRMVPLLGAGAILGAALFAAHPRSRSTVAELPPGQGVAASQPAPDRPAPGLQPSAPTASGTPGTADGQEPASLMWTAPASWIVIPNASPMRIVTYRVSEQADAAEVSVTRAGGSPDANIQRWMSQFDGAREGRRASTRVRGIDVTLIEISGVYRGGAMGMSGSASEPHPGWALVAAIAQPPVGRPYFFKLLGPSASVGNARESFDALVASLGPR